MLRQNKASDSDRFASLAQPNEVFKIPIQSQFMRTLLDLLRDMFKDFISKDSANTHFMLMSEAGAIYRVTVDDTGNLQTEYIRG